jgi:hypothetical protein
MKNIFISITLPMHDWLIGMEYTHHNEITEMDSGEFNTEIVSILSFGLLLLRIDFIL